MIKTIFNLYKAKGVILGCTAPDYVITRHHQGDAKEQIVSFALNDIGKSAADEFQNISNSAAIRKYYLKSKSYGEIDPSNPIWETTRTYTENGVTTETQPKIPLDRIGTITITGKTIEAKMSIDALPLPDTGVSLL